MLQLKWWLVGCLVWGSCTHLSVLHPTGTWTHPVLSRCRNEWIVGWFGSNHFSPELWRLQQRGGCCTKCVCEQGLNLSDGAGWLSGCIPASLLTGDVGVPTPKGFLSPCTHNEAVCSLSDVDYVTETLFIKYKAAARLLVLHVRICIAHSFKQNCNPFET